jgi:zinc D-Ala-D-Ala dipeptidase
MKKADLIEITTLDPSLKLDIRYATPNCLVGRPVYREARAFLHREVAEALVRVHRRLRSDGVGLLIFDGYRPWSVTKIFWDETPEEHRIFLANPVEGSIHNRGFAVDLSLYDLATGKEVAMPSEFDEMSERSYISYEGGTPESRQSRDLLKVAMNEQGFTGIRFEWWHFNYPGWQEYPVLDLTFDQIR